MSKKKVVLIFTAVVLLLTCLVVSLSGCNNERETVAYTVQVKSEGGMPISDIKVTVYKDSRLQELQWVSATDDDGKITFNAQASKTYYAVLEQVPDGYNTEPYYELSNENSSLNLETVLGDANDMSGITYKLGSVVHDFTVTATDGKEYKISELLKTKKAVVLNFWFINCGPCKMEFPYLQQAYIDYQDDIALVAINPCDGTDDTVSAYAIENNLTFPMASTDSSWEDIMQLTAYPTTVVIDRYGTICMIHKGMVTSKDEFTKVFEYFTAEDYEQTLIKDISDIE